MEQSGEWQEVQPYNQGDWRRNEIRTMRRVERDDGKKDCASLDAIDPAKPTANLTPDRNRQVDGSTCVSGV